MANKIYVKETERKTVDDDKLQVIKVYEHKIDKPSFIVFLDK